MDILARTMIWKGQPPVKGYIHSKGLVVYENDIYKAKEYLAEALDKQKNIINDFTYVLAVVWGDESINAKMIDMLGFILDSWPGDPDAWPGLISNGEFVEGVSKFRLENNDDMALILEKEGELRERARDIGEYARTFPPIIFDNKRWDIKEI